MSSLTIRLMSANGKGFSNAAFTMLNSPVAAAIPTARETTDVAAKPGLRRKIRSAYRRSAARMSIKKFPQRRGRKKLVADYVRGKTPTLNLSSIVKYGNEYAFFDRYCKRDFIARGSQSAALHKDLVVEATDS